MRLALTLAARNLLRHARRTLLTVSALVLGISLMILGRAWTAAMEQAVVEPAKNATLGHVEVFARDAAADEGGRISFIMPQNNYRLISAPRELIGRVLQGEPRLVGGLSRFMVGALLSLGDTSQEAILIGIDPAAREAVYPAIELHEGRHFSAGEKPAGLLLNRGVARKLGAKTGDEVVALGTASDGRLTAARLRVTGIWTVKGLEAYEWGACYVDLGAVQDLVDAPDQAGVLVFRQRDRRQPAGPIAAALNERFQREGIEAEAHTWEEMGGPFIGGVMVTRFIAGITNFVMAIIVAAGVMNTALMAVFERTREIGTLRAVGARRLRILQIFLAEALVIGTSGALFGALLGALLILLFGRVGIPAFSEAQRYSYGGDYLFPVIDWADLFTVPAVMLVICVLAGLGPAVMASRMRPADSLRYV